MKEQGLIHESRRNTERGSVPEVTRSLQKKRGTIAWTIAGFDPSSGAGVTADLQVFAAHGLWGCSAITALTVQSTVGVFRTEPISPELLRETLERLWEDTPPAGIKIGMLGRPELMGVVARFLAGHSGRQPNRRPHVVLDPVLRSSSGRELYPRDHVEELCAELLPHVDWVTPNWTELEVLSGVAIQDLEDVERAAGVLTARCPHLNVVATGGDQESTTDLFVPAGDAQPALFRGTKVETTSTHGTGCAFSSALLGELVRGCSPETAVRSAKAYVEEALRRAPGVGKGRGPLELLWPLLPARSSTLLP